MMTGLIPFWPWMVIIIVATILWVLPKAVRLNNLVLTQRKGLVTIVTRVWLDVTDEEWSALNVKLDSVSYMKHLMHVSRGGDWKDLYRPVFFGELENEDHI